MGLFSKNGKLLVDGARLRGCCCEGWKLTSISYTVDGTPNCCAMVLSLPDPDDEHCIPGTLWDALWDVTQRATGTVTQASPACNYPCANAVMIPQTLFPTSFREEGDVGICTANLFMWDHQDWHGGEYPPEYMVDYNFDLLFKRCVP